MTPELNDLGTHGMGVLCEACRATLVPEGCTCGTQHGYTYQKATEWAALTWPKHACFQHLKSPVQKGVGDDA